MQSAASYHMTRPNLFTAFGRCTTRSISIQSVQVVAVQGLCTGGPSEFGSSAVEGAKCMAVRAGALGLGLCGRRRRDLSLGKPTCSIAQFDQSDPQRPSAQGFKKRNRSISPSFLHNPDVMREKADVCSLAAQPRFAALQGRCTALRAGALLLVH